MSIRFTAHDHKYVSIDQENPIDWTSVTTFIKQFQTPFDKEGVALNCSNNKKNKKWFGKSPQEIMDIWDKEAKRATDLGTWYHDDREKSLLMHDTLTRNGREVPIISPRMDGDVKLATAQTLTEGVYPEHLIYLKSAGICGQADRVEVIQNKINVYDYKTNKEIKTKGFTDRLGNTKMLLGPCSHLEDCHLNIYALQLSTYMYMMLKHNHYLDPGVLEIHHVSFEIKGEDENGYPITATTSTGEPIVKEVVPYELKYLKREVIEMIKYHKKHNS